MMILLCQQVRLVYINGNMIVTAQSLIVTGGAGSPIMGSASVGNSIYGGKGGIGIYFVGSYRTMSVSSDTYIEVRGGDGGASLDISNTTYEYAGDGNLAIKNVSIDGLDSTDRFYGGNGGSINAGTTNCYVGNGIAAKDSSVSTDLNTAIENIVFVSGQQGAVVEDN